MKIEFTDFYGQHVDVNNETASGNVRIRVRTTQNLNDVRLVQKVECPIETDISLDLDRLRLLANTLNFILSQESEE